jgi:hypothetical protein
MSQIQVWQGRLLVAALVLLFLGLLASVGMYVFFFAASKSSAFGTVDFLIGVVGVPVAVLGLNSLVWRWRLPRIEMRPRERRTASVVATTLILASLSVLVVFVVYLVMFLGAFPRICGGDC